MDDRSGTFPNTGIGSSSFLPLLNFSSLYIYIFSVKSSDQIYVSFWGIVIIHPKNFFLVFALLLLDVVRSLAQRDRTRKNTNIHDELVFEPGVSTISPSECM